MANKSFSEFNTTTTIGGSDLMLLSKQSSDGYDTRNAAMQTVANSINNQLTMASLDTTNKTIIGAINENKSNIDSLKTNGVYSITPISSSVGLSGSAIEVVSGGLHFVHVLFGATADIPANTTLFNTRTHTNTIANIGFPNTTGTKTFTFTFANSGGVTNLLPISSGDKVCISIVLV